ncbi:MAG: hypothetical protein QW680_08365, partial [Pyrobaculum sp.]
MIAIDSSGEPIPTRGFKLPQRSEKGPRQMPEPQRPPPPPPAAERIIRKLEVEKPATFITGRAAVRPEPTPARPPDYVVRQVAPVRPPDRVVTQVRPEPTPARPPDYVVRQVAPVRPPDRVVTQVRPEPTP